MNSAEPWSDVLTSRRIVEVDGRHVFDLHFSERNSSQERQNARHGVSSLTVIDQYQEALVSAITRLTNETHGWRFWNGDAHFERVTRVVAVFDLGSSMLGAAVNFRGQTPYLVLNARSLDLPEVARVRREATVAHEVVHLLQYETSAYQYWPAQGRIGEARDPNWWLHEATALALEAEMSPAPATSLPLLWTWATSPEYSLEADRYGTLAAPFLIYLGRKYGWSLLADVYRATSKDVEGMRGTDILAWALRQTLSASATDDCLARNFFEFCVDAAFIGEGGTVLPDELHAVVGPRALTNRFTIYPLRDAATNAEIDHLGCRYFEFIPTEVSGELHISITLSRPLDAVVLRGAVVVVSHDGLHRTASLAKSSDQHSVSVPFSAKDVSRAVLVIANCAYGPGWAAHDRCQFQLAAAVE